VTELSKFLQQALRDSTQKFEYYVLAIVGAGCWYLTDHLHPHRITGPRDILAPCTLLLVSGGFLTGLFRLHAANIMLTANAEAVRVGDQLISLSELFDKNEARVDGKNLDWSITYPLTGETLRKNGVIDKLGTLRASYNSLLAQTESQRKRAKRWETWRNSFLACGVVLFALDRIILPYFI